MKILTLSLRRVSLETLWTIWLGNLWSFLPCLLPSVLSCLASCLLWPWSAFHPLRYFCPMVGVVCPGVECPAMLPIIEQRMKRLEGLGSMADIARGLAVRFSCLICLDFPQWEGHFSIMELYPLKAKRHFSFIALSLKKSKPWKFHVYPYIFQTAKTKQPIPTNNQNENFKELFTWWCFRWRSYGLYIVFCLLASNKAGIFDASKPISWLKVSFMVCILTVIQAASSRQKPKTTT